MVILTDKFFREQRWESKEKSNKQQLQETLIDSEEYEYVTVPPDGGFGWVIVIAAMLCNLVCDGTLFAFGVMKTYLKAHFQCSDALILMVGSVPCGVYLLVGPFVSGLANRYGCRPIIIIGSIGASICMALSTLSPNAWVMIIIYGIFGGIFFGMVYLPSVVMVSFYFDKKRAIANGIVTAGTGIGALSFGPLANLLMGKFGWQIGMIIFAGMMLSCIAFGAIMKPLKPKRVPIKRTGIESQTPTIIKSDRSALISSSIPYETMISDSNMPLLPSYNDEVHTNTFTSVLNVDIPDGSALNVPSKHTRIRTLSGISGTSLNSADENRVGVSDPENASRPLYKKDALFTGSKQQLHLSHTSLHSNPYMSSVTNLPAAITESKKKQSASQAFADILSAMTDFSILKNRQMLFICIGNIFSMLGYYLPIMCLVSFAIDDNGVHKDTAPYLLTIFGFFNTLGRFAGGPIAMIPYFSALGVHNIMLYMAGILTVLAAYANNFTTCALYAGFCGFAIAPHISLLPSIICDCVGLDRYTTAFGVLFLFRGVSSIIGPPAAGFLKDYTKRYDLAFVIGGTMIIIAAVFHYALYFIQPERREEKKEKEVHV